MNRAQRRHQRLDVHPISGLRIKDATSTELHQQLVKDAVGGVETPLPWTIGAIRKISRVDRISEEEAYQRWRQEVASLGAVMPGAPLA